MRLLAIDPGSRQSAWLEFDGHSIGCAKIEDNEQVRQRLRLAPTDCQVVIEMIQSYGMTVGRDVFETVYWTGRFAEAAPNRAERVYRKDIKLHLCGNSRAKNANVRQALIDRFPPSGGGAIPQIGTKKQPGPLYGMKSHLWAALAVAVFYHDQVEGKP